METTAPETEKKILDPAIRARIEANRQKALFIRRAKLVSHPYAKM